MSHDGRVGSDGRPWPSTFDGQEWARKFIEQLEKTPEIATDLGTMIGWFANAIMVGYDDGYRKGQRELANEQECLIIMLKRANISHTIMTGRDTDSYVEEVKMPYDTVIKIHTPMDRQLDRSDADCYFFFHEGRLQTTGTE